MKVKNMDNSVCERCREPSEIKVMNGHYCNVKQY